MREAELIICDQTIYDYAQAGGYFITICVHQRACLLGSIEDGQVRLTDAGRIADQLWRGLDDRFSQVSLDVSVIMPNHLHGILYLADGPTQGYRLLLGEVVRSFKAASSRLIRTSGQLGFGWQRGYDDHVIRTEADLDRIRRYIVENPLRWELDRENPAVVQRRPSEASIRRQPG